MRGTGLFHRQAKVENFSSSFFFGKLTQTALSVPHNLPGCTPEDAWSRTRLWLAERASISSMIPRMSLPGRYLTLTDSRITVALRLYPTDNGSVSVAVSRPSVHDVDSCGNPFHGLIQSHLPRAIVVMTRSKFQDARLDAQYTS